MHELLWTPSPKDQQDSGVFRLMTWLREEHNLTFNTYADLWEWSVASLEEFWGLVWKYFNLGPLGADTKAISQRTMPGSEWFLGTYVNYTQYLFEVPTKSPVAIYYLSENREIGEISWEELRGQVGAVAGWLRRQGVRPGDTVAGYLPNIPQAVTVFLACALIGAVWSGCSPEFGAKSVIDRFQQIRPKVLFAVDGYSYGGKDFDKRDAVTWIREELGNLPTVVISRDAKWANDEVVPWTQVLATPPDLHAESLPFSHPLWVLYSSGTTGLPKAIVHSHGGILLAHLLSGSVHLDIHSSDRVFWYTSTSWMVWNILVGGLLLGASIVLYDGSPTYPTHLTLWEIIDKYRVTLFGAGAAYFQSMANSAVCPMDSADLGSLRGIFSTGSPLSPDSFTWIYQRAKADVWLSSVSGGTDVCCPFVGGVPTEPVYSGEIQVRCLGCDVRSYDERGNSLTDAVGELVIAQPMPSMPIYFWGDVNHHRYLDSYFRKYPGVWCHGDWITITQRGTCIIHGRSDATINRYGIRMGTSDIYRVVEALPEVIDSLAVDLEGLGGRSWMVLFVVPASANASIEKLIERINSAITKDLSPRHRPDRIVLVQDIPRTLNGKKLESPVRKILKGMAIAEAVDLDAMKNPESMYEYEQIRDSGIAF